MRTRSQVVSFEIHFEKHTQGKRNGTKKLFGLLFPQLPKIYLSTVKIISMYILDLVNIGRGDFNELWCLTDE